MTPDTRLAALGLTLPPPAAAVGNYAPAIISRGVLHTSGQLPWIGGDLLFAGRIGRDLTQAQGYAACRLATLNALAQIQAHAGSLARVERIIRLEGVLNLDPDFTEGPAVLDGASDLLAAVFEERGRCHTRMIYANPVMPLDAACLIVLWAEVTEPAAAP